MDILFLRHKCSNASFSKIYTKITYNGIRVELGSTGIEIETEHWDIVNKRVLHEDPFASLKNEQLLSIEGDIMMCFNDLLRSKTPFTVHDIKKAIKAQGRGTTDEIEPSVIQAFDLFLVEIEKSEEHSPGTKQKYRHVRDNVLQFLIDRKNTKLLVSEFDEKIMIDYRHWMKSVCKYAPTTIHKRFQVVKQAIRWAVKEIPSCERNALLDVTFKEPDPKANIYLTVKQFEALKAYKFRTKSKQEVADLFIVYCRTGFHYQDLRDIIKDHKEFVRTGINGKEWLYKSRVKTKVTAKVPFFEEVDDILKKYGGWENLPIKSNDTMNNTLKIIADELNFPDEIIKSLSVKAGRKTLSDWLLNVKGWTLQGVCVLLGIKNEKYVACYGKSDERRVLLEMSRTA
jgi:hypothetical protein